MYIFTVFIYIKNLQYLWKASRRHQTHSHLPSFVLFRGLPMDTVRGAPAVAESSHSQAVFSPLSYKAFSWATTDQFSSHLNTEHIILSGSVPWLNNYIFPYSIYIFFVNPGKQKFTLLLSIKIKWKNLSFKSLPITFYLFLFSVFMSLALLLILKIKHKQTVKKESKFKSHT